MKKFFTFVTATLVALTMNAAAISVAEALQIAGELAQGATTEAEYEIEGYVTAMEGSEDGGWAQYQNQIFWIADEAGTAASNKDGALEIYQGVPSERVYVGDKVKVKGNLSNYQGTLETAKKATVEILEKAERPAEEVADVVFGKDDFTGKGTERTGSEVTVTKDGVTFWCDKAYGDGQYGVRCYKGGHVKISAEEQIGKIKFLFGLDNDGGLNEIVVVNAKEWEYELPSQARFNLISVFFGEAEPIEPEEVTVITVAEAMAIGEAIQGSGKTSEKYSVKGYVINAKPYGDKYEGAQTFYMSDDPKAEKGEFTAFNCNVADPGVEAGDYVIVTGKIQKYVYESGDYVIEITGGDVQYAEGVENVFTTVKAQKVMINGVLYIVRGNKMYDVRGAQIR